MDTEKRKQSRRAYREANKQMTLVLSPEMMQQLQEQAEKLNLSKSGYLKKLIEEDLKKSSDQEEKKPVPEEKQPDPTAFTINIEEFEKGVKETINNAFDQMTKYMLENPNDEKVKNFQNAILPPQARKKIFKKLTEK